MLEITEKEKNGAVTKGSDEIKVMLTNMDGRLPERKRNEN